MEERLKKVAEGWYLTEPALFMAFCSHFLTENRIMKVAMRSGRQMIEYNPVMMQDWNDAMLAERLKLEVARILLGHPYQRLPYNADLSIAGLASDVTLDSLYRSHTVFPVPRDLDLPGNLCFEEYYILLRRYFSKISASGDDVSAGEYHEGHENVGAGLHDSRFKPVGKPSGKFQGAGHRGEYCQNRLQGGAVHVQGVSNRIQTAVDTDEAKPQIRVRADGKQERLLYPAARGA